MDRNRTMEDIEQAIIDRGNMDLPEVAAEASKLWNEIRPHEIDYHSEYEANDDCEK